MQVKMMYFETKASNYDFLREKLYATTSIYADGRGEKYKGARN